MTTYSRVGALSASIVVTAVLSMTLVFTPTALADDTGSSDASPADAIAQTDGPSSVAAQTDGSSSSAAQPDGSSSAPVAEAPAPVAEQAPVAAQSAEEDGWHTDAGGTYYVEGGSRVASAWRVLWSGPSGTAGPQRYWLGADGYLARGRLVTEAESGWWAYAEADGTIARGKCTDPSTGCVYLADNDGRLETPGWHVTSAYGSGLQRYWVDATAHACVPGYSADGWDHYTTSAGYVLRGTSTDSSTGCVYLADNDGRLAGPGWVVGDYGDGLQRYWVDATAHACVPGYSTDGWAHYTTAAGYVARGAYAANGVVYIADNDGLLAGPGWVVGNYGDGLQRYWVDATAHACVPGYSKDGWAHWTTDRGYVLRGSMRYDSDGILVADDEGKLAECYSSGGWLVTSAFTGSLERYRIDDCCDGILGARSGSFSIDGNSYYGTSSGYVARNTNVVVDGSFYHANNDGILSEIDTGGDYAMWAKAQGYTSDTNYLILINCSEHLVGVYYGGFMNWSSICMYPCGNGKDSTPTVKGSFTVGAKGYSFGSGYTCYYYTQFSGNYLFHSILYYENTWNVMDGRLGLGVSHGCVRLAPENAKWIYDNVPRGSRVISY